MTKRCTFIRLLAEEEKDTALSNAIGALIGGNESSPIFAVDPTAFAMIPGSPFAYWVSDRIRRLFVELPSFEGDGRTVHQGLATADDFRFVRAWWEVPPNKILTGTVETKVEEFKAQTSEGKKWVPFVKGKSNFPYYAEYHLIVNWENDGAELRRFPQAYIRNENCYFQAGLTWPARPLSRGSFVPFSSGMIFSHTWMMLHAPENQIWQLCAILNSDAYIGLLHLLMPRGVGETGATLKYEAGYVKSVPIPSIDEESQKRLNEMAVYERDKFLEFSRYELTSHTFVSPGFTPLEGKKNLMEIFDRLNIRFQENKEHIEVTQQMVNQIALVCYALDKQPALALLDVPGISLPEDLYPSLLSAELISYTLGCVFGRWDIRYATGKREPPELPDPVAPLPVCSPGMLQGDDGLPLTETPPGYPLAIDWDGILVDDESHGDDVVLRIRDVFQVIWGEQAAAIEQEACELLSVKSLRDYFRKPGKGGFWDDHVKRYSKSRRKAPIYWLLQSAKRNYALWIYYHRLDADTLFKALEHYVKPKVQREESRLQEMVAEKADLGVGGPAAKRLEAGIEKQEAFIAELMDFRDKLQRAADLFLTPDLDDGVVLTIAPLHELVPWSEPKKYWNALLEGKYEWSSIGKQLRQKGLVK